MQNKKELWKGAVAKKCSAESENPRGLISMNRTNEYNNIKNWLVHP